MVVRSHLADLIRGGLIRETPFGRNRYYTLLGPEVATALEALSQICPATPVRSLRQSQQARALGLIRTCYDHLAGAIAVGLFDAMLDREWLIPGGMDYVVSPAGRHALSGLGVDPVGAAERRRHFARPCLDWTERRPHLAGSLGAALATSLLQQGWFEPARVGRGLHITEVGRTRLHDVFGLGPLAG